MDFSSLRIVIASHRLSAFVNLTPLRPKREVGWYTGAMFWTPIWRVQWEKVAETVAMAKASDRIGSGGLTGGLSTRDNGLTRRDNSLEARTPVAIMPKATTSQVVKM